jgi:hypothetical protein
MLAQRSEKNSKRDEIGLFAEPVEVSERKGEEVSVFDTRYEERQRFRNHCVQIVTTIQSVLRDLLPEVKLTT